MNAVKLGGGWVDRWRWMVRCSGWVVFCGSVRYRQRWTSASVAPR